MNIEQLDRHCDVFEHRLKNAEQVSAEQFLEELGLPADDELANELRKLEREYRNGKSLPADADRVLPSGDVFRPTDLMPSVGTETVIGPYKLLSCCRKSAKGAWGRSTWPSRPGRSSAAWP